MVGIRLHRVLFTGLSRTGPAPHCPFFLLFHLLFFFLECHCFIMLLVSAVQQSASAISTHMSPSRTSPLPTSLPSHPLGHHRAEPSSLAVQWLPTSCFTRQCVCGQFYCLSSCPLPPLLLCPQVHSPPSASLFPPCKELPLYRFSRFHICQCPSLLGHHYAL